MSFLHFNHVNQIPPHVPSRMGSFLSLRTFHEFAPPIVKGRMSPFCPLLLTPRSFAQTIISKRPSLERSLSYFFSEKKKTCLFRSLEILFRISSSIYYRGSFFGSSNRKKPPHFAPRLSRDRKKPSPETAQTGSPYIYWIFGAADSI